ncbi:MAG: PIN domain nuclease [Deltaproteobacteria bacterium]
MALKYLADKSALARMHHSAVASRLTSLLLGGDVGTCSIIDLEILYSARSHADLVAVRAERATFPQLAILQADFDRAIDVLSDLARTGHHRAASIPDLLIAAISERHKLTILHYDKDFDVIAAVTKQRTEWIVPAGGVP